MMNKRQLGRQMYDAWRSATPLGEDLPPEWQELPRPQQMRWEYVAECIGEYLSQALNAQPVAR